MATPVSHAEWLGAHWATTQAPPVHPHSCTVGSVPQDSGHAGKEAGGMVEDVADDVAVLVDTPPMDAEEAGVT